jgi:starch synthase
MSDSNKNPKKILFVTSEVFPYMPESTLSLIGRYLPQNIQENGREIRVFMPKYGIINERRNQLHEVIRLSGMNITIKSTDLPLTIKVSSISQARMQVYFIENEDYFKRKAVYFNEKGEFFKDNDERAMFFALGVLETVKRLRWKPDLVHCHGWITHFLPLFLKKTYSADPIFAETKIVLSLYNDYLDNTFSPDSPQKLLDCDLKGISGKDTEVYKPANGINLAKLAIRYADGVIAGVPKIDPRVSSYVEELKLPFLPYCEVNENDKAYVEHYNSFYDRFLPEDK